MNSEHKRLEGPPCNNPGETAKILRNYKKRYQFCAQNNFRIQSSKVMKERKKRKGKKPGKLCAKFRLMLQNKTNMLSIITMTGGGVLRYLALDESFNIFI